MEKWKKNYKNKNWHQLAYLLISEYYDPLYSHNLKSKKNVILKTYYLKSLNNKSLIDLSLSIKNDLNIYLN